MYYMLYGGGFVTNMSKDDITINPEDCADMLRFETFAECEDHAIRNGWRAAVEIMQFDGHKSKQSDRPMTHAEFVDLLENGNVSFVW